jgi:hypothetical protein
MVGDNLAENRAAIKPDTLVVGIDVGSTRTWPGRAFRAGHSRVSCRY